MAAKMKWKIAIASLVLVLAVLLPEVISGGWHLIHGRSVAFRGWDVTLPFEWFAMKHGDGMTTERMTRLLWQHGPVAVFLPVHFGKNYSFNYNVYAKEQEQTFQARGYQLIGQQRVRIADAEGYCWTFASKTRLNDSWIACFVPKDLTSVDYIGNGSYANSFGEILSHIKRVSPAN
jgi:hypothetical protein